MSKQYERDSVLNNLRQQMEGWEKEGYDVSELKMLLLSVDTGSSAKPSHKRLWLYILIPVIIVVVIAVVVVVVMTSSGSSTPGNTSSECASGCQWAQVDNGICEGS